MRLEESEDRRIQDRPTSLFRTGANDWWLFCLAIVVLKFLLLALDSAPKFYLGDSISYIWTALTGWIPDDRSYFYGYVIRWSAVWTGSLTSLLILQVFLGSFISISVAWICRVHFRLPARLAYLFGFLCAIDPLQCTWERYVMTETCSLFFYVLVLQQSLAYLRDRRMTSLVLVQLFSVITIGFRMVFLIPVQAMAVALPLIAFVCGSGSSQTTRTAWLTRLHFLGRRIFWQHLAVSVITMFVLDQGYQRAYGLLTHRAPAHLHATGYFLLAICGPALQPQDATDPRLGKLIEQGDEFALRDFSHRNDQRFIAGYLIDRWRRLEPNRIKSTQIATETALNTFRRDPAAVIGFAAKTYFILWRPHEMKRFAQWDLGDGRFRDSDLKLLAERFHWTGRAEPASEAQTFAKWFYVAATPWYFMPMIAPLFALGLLFIARDKAQAWLLLIHTTLLLAVTFLFATGPFTRYLQPLSLLTLLILALAVSSFPRAGLVDGKSLSRWFSRMHWRNPGSRPEL